jgi:hypothetical protein
VEADVNHRRQESIVLIEAGRQVFDGQEPALLNVVSHSGT